MPDLAKDRPSSEKALQMRLQPEGERFRALLVPAIWKAIGDARAEVEKMR